MEREIKLSAGAFRRLARKMKIPMAPAPTMSTMGMTLLPPGAIGAGAVTRA